jgi:hypothetical protein
MSAPLSEDLRKRIRRKIDEQPDITLRELIDALSLPVGVPALCKTIHRRLGLCRKKNGAHGGTGARGRGGTTKRVESKAGRP